ncbi:hypothetical protein WISP_25843 [Willisornis vidua]|uniref:Uncharacterized protein n=1 Tax=Willisornis vidua TaxID=1566151 RepID=A0ABQ9DLT1_9PASS|nr:hypothetical protein WISP_25843 [Willisornis vidua]
MVQLPQGLSWAAGQDAIGPLGHLGTQLTHDQPAVTQHLELLLCWVTSQLLISKPVAIHGVVVTQEQDLALCLIEPHIISLSPSDNQALNTVNIICVNDTCPDPSAKPFYHPREQQSSLVSCKLTEGALIPLIQIIDKGIKQN